MLRTSARRLLCSQRRLVVDGRGAASRSRRLSSAATSTIDVATEGDVKANSLLDQPDDGAVVGFARTKLNWRPRTGAQQRVAIEASRLFSSSPDPLEHTAADVGRIFQLDSTMFEVFYHNGYCGERVAARNQQLKTSAMMVRHPGLKLRDELLALDNAAGLGDAAGWLVHGQAGVGKSMVLNYVLAAMQRAGWLVAVMPHAADWTLGFSARSAQAANEAYRVSDTNFFSHVPPELESSALHENPEASAHFLVSFYLSQRDKLATIPIKDPERRAHYADVAADAAAGPTLADMLAPVVRDSHEAFADFPMPVRPVHDLLRELQLVTEYPTLLVVDGWNRWTQMATSCHWRTKRPLHASDLLVPALCGGDLRFGEGMARGVMLCATTHAGAKPPGVPLRMRKHVPLPPEFRNLHEIRRDARFSGRLVEVRPYRLDETQAILELYAMVGHMHNAAIDGQLRNGELANKVRLMTSGVAEDVFKLAQQM